MYKCLVFDWSGTLFAGFAGEDGTALFFGVADMLKDLRAQGYIIASVSMLSHARLAAEMEENGVKQYFSLLKGSDSGPMKPDPAVMHDIMLELDLVSHELLMVGDTTMDMHFAKNAGIDAVGVHETEVGIMKEAGAKTVLEYVTDLPLFLASVQDTASSL